METLWFRVGGPWRQSPKMVLGGVLQNEDEVVGDIPATQHVDNTNRFTWNYMGYKLDP